MRRPLRPLLAALLIAVATPAFAGDAPKKGANDGVVMHSQSFLSAHPDLNYRLEGLEAYRAGDYEKALMFFRKAARYADKPAQGMVAEMLMRGEGTESDPALAYAWMDLAAERNYPTMVLNREKYWRALDEAQRKDAVERGRAVFAEFADAVAKPRLESKLRRGRHGATGSRAGGVGNSVTILIPGPGGVKAVDATQYYADKFWEPEQYWAWQNDDWKVLPEGRVEIGPLESGSEAAPAPEAEQPAG
jgi:TPR repeat protein